MQINVFITTDRTVGETVYINWKGYCGGNQGKREPGPPLPLIKRDMEKIGKVFGDFLVKDGF
jgi:hypothetical protein